MLHILPELAPYTGNSGPARVSSLLCQSLARLGAEVTAVAPAPPDPERWGFARRLRPLAIPTDQGIMPVTIYEGMLASGRARALLVQTDDIGVVVRAALAAAAREKRWPHIVHATHGSELAPLLVKAGWLNQGSTPATIFHLYDLDVTTRRRGNLNPADPAVKKLIAAATNQGVHGLASRERALSIDTPSTPRSASLMAGSIASACADRIVVESPTYAGELLIRDASEGHAMSLAQVRDRIVAIAHGVDDQRWRFAVDPHVPGHPTQDLDGRKSLAKLAVQRELGLAPQAKRPLVAVLGPYEGLDTETARALGETEAQLVFLLDSQRDSEVLPMLRPLARHRVAARFADDSTTHRLIGAADFLLLPHRFRSTGPHQLYCWHYGVLPIVPNTGAFADQVVELDPDTATGNGIVFNPNEADAMVHAVKRAVRAFRQPRFGELRRRVSNADLSWKTAAIQYFELYRQLM